MWVRLKDCKNEIWDVNPEGIGQICNSWGRSHAVFQSARVVTQTSSVAGLWKAVGAQVDVDWNHAKIMTCAYGSREYDRIRYKIPLQSGFGNAARELARLRGNARATTSRMQIHFNEASRINENTIGQMTKNVAAARLTRDIAASTLVCLATGPVATSTLANAGMWAGGGLATGAVIKGAGKYQDTGNVAAACVETGFELLFGLIPISAGASGISKEATIALAVFCKAPAEVAKSAVAGESLWKGAASGGIEVLATLGGPLLKGWLDKQCLPIAVRALKSLGGNSPVTKAMVQMAKTGVGTTLDVGETLTVDQVKNRAGDKIDSMQGPKVSTSPNVHYARDLYLDSSASDAKFVEENCLRYLCKW